jgi:hypothetical protein
VVLYNPKLVADSVTGHQGSRETTDAMMWRQTRDSAVPTIALPRTAIATVSLRRLDVLKTTGAVLGGVLLVSLVGCAATQCLDFWDEP